MIKRKSLVDQEIKGCFKAGSSDQEQILAIKNFDRRRRWKYRVHSGDYPLRLYTATIIIILLWHFGLTPSSVAIEGHGLGDHVFKPSISHILLLI